MAERYTGSKYFQQKSEMELAKSRARQAAQERPTIETARNGSQSQESIQRRLESILRNARRVR